MWNVAVCDDDYRVCSHVQSLLYQYDIGMRIAIFNTGAELLKSGADYDVIFLDIEMPGISGIQTADELRRRNKNLYVIFLTNHPDYVQEAFKVRAYRYFNKPVNPKRLVETMNQVKQEALENIKILFSCNGRKNIINISDITHIEAYGDGSYVYTGDKVYETRQPLKYWLSRLQNQNFIKVHQAFIVSLDRINEIEKSKLFLTGGIEIPISRRNQHKVKEEIYSFIEKNAGKIQVER